MKKFGLNSPDGNRYAVLKKGLIAMKITLILILISTFNLLATGTYSQTARVSLKLNQTSLKQVLKEIERSSEFYFLYNNDLVNVERKVDIEADNEQINTILDRLFTGQDTKFAVYDRQIVISPSNMPLPQDAQRKVSGKVTDQSGAPIPGVSVVVKGTATGVTTDNDGKFSLSLPLDAKTLTFSFVGMRSQEVALGNRTTINITMVEETIGLDEVVAVGYGTQKKANLTGAVASVSSKVLESRPLTNLGQGLQGLIPNLNITVGNGRPGTGATFNIRGITSINGGSPLVLVDGVQMDPNQINPNDIENVSVLKDASSSAIYGVRGAFGVVLITTKQGRKNTTMNIDYSFAYTLTTPTRLPKTMNSVDYIKTFLEADATGAISGGSRGSAPYSPTSTDLQKAIEYVNNPTSDNYVYVDPAFPNMYRYVANTNWVKEVYNDVAPELQHNLSLTGGSDNTTYKATLGYFNQEGLAKTGNQNFNRYNGTLKINSDLKSWLGVNFSMLLNRINDNSLSPTNTGGSAELAGGDLRSIMPVRHPDGNFAGQGIFTNPVAIATYNGRSITYSNDLWLSGGFELKPAKNFKIIGDYTWNSYNYNRTEALKAYNEYGVNGVFLSVYPWTTPARVTESNNNDTYTAMNFYAQYENTFATKHYLKAMVGYNQELKQTKSISARAKNLLNQDFPVLSLNNDDKPVLGASIQEWAVSGSFFRVNYAFDNKYLLEVNGRYDGTSRFGRGNRYAFQPSISAAWRISQERFFNPLKSVINDLKLRASYGTLGNQQLTSNYPYIATMGYGTTSYIFGTQPQTYISAPGLVSSDFTWEKVTTKNIGLDLGLFSNRMTGSFDYYIRETKDMVVAGTPLPTVLGTSAPSRNAASLETKGFELSIGWNDKINDDWRYNVSLALSDYMAEITKYDLNPKNLITTYYVGQKIGEIWGFETQGFYASDADAAKIDNSKIWGGKWLAGDIQYKDLDNDSKITTGDNTLSNPGDRRKIGNNTPRYQFGINMGLNYKGFDFTMFMQGVAKRDLALSGNFFWGYSSEWNTVTEALVGNYWTPDHTDAYFARLRFNGQPNQQTQTKYLQNGAYLRMKQITLGYTIPESIVNKVHINRLRVYVTGQNLFEFTKIYKNFDPEQPAQSSYPINRAISFGIQLGL